MRTSKIAHSVEHFTVNETVIGSNPIFAPKKRTSNSGSPNTQSQVILGLLLLSGEPMVAPGSVWTFQSAASMEAALLEFLGEHPDVHVSISVCDFVDAIAIALPGSPEYGVLSPTTFRISSAKLSAIGGVAGLLRDLRSSRVPGTYWKEAVLNPQD